jgi:hypothetical protein
MTQRLDYFFDYGVARHRWYSNSDATTAPLPTDQIQPTLLKVSAGI